jgi:5-methylthioribose kinase
VGDCGNIMEIDIENFDVLRDYLAHYVTRVEPVSFQKLVGGVSNRAVRVTWPDGSGWVVKQALAKLRVKVDWFGNPDRIRVEAEALRWIHRLAPPGTTPLLIFEDATNHLLAMEAVPEGHENWKSVLLSGRIVPDHFQQFGVLLGTTQRRCFEFGPEIGTIFADREHFISLRLEPYYLYTGQQVPSASAFLKELAEETLCHKLSLVHGDFSPKNTLIYQGKLILLDYEVVHFGDPAFDTGFALTHFLSKANHMSENRARLADSAVRFWRAYYGEIAPLAWEHFEERSVRHTLGCLLARVAGKSQLEYLTPEEASRQKNAVLLLIGVPPVQVDDLVTRFLQHIETDAEN